jgi:hypothetical protein
MFKTMLITVLKPMLYAVIPLLIDFGIHLVQHIGTYKPQGSFEVTIWEGVGLAACAGLVKLLVRLKSWKPELVGK